MTQKRASKLVKDDQGKQVETNPARDDIPYCPPIKVGKGRPNTYVKRYEIGERIVWALSIGKDTTWVSEHVKDGDNRRLSKQLIFYYKELAISKGILVEIEEESDDGLRFKCYGRGPNFHLLKFKDWTKSGSEPILSRVHAADGNAINVSVANSNLESAITVKDSNGEPHEVELFRKATNNGVFCTSTYQLYIPFEVVGYHSAYATLTYKIWNRNGEEHLFISPPEAHLTLEHLRGELEYDDSYPEIPQILDSNQIEGHQDDPFCSVIAYILGILEEKGWVFNGWTNDQSFHYAIDARAVKKYYPALMDHVSVLNGSNKEEDLIIYMDKSHGRSELETTEKGLAIEMMTLLEFTRQRVRGEKKYPHGWYKNQLEV